MIHYLVDWLASVVLQFFKLFPEYTDNPFWIAGESYGGKFATTLAYWIHTNSTRRTTNSRSNTTDNNDQMITTIPNNINLAGIMIGSGFIDAPNMLKFGDHLYHNGLIDLAQREHFYKEESKIAKHLSAKETLPALMIFDELIYGEIRNVHSYFHKVTGLQTWFNFKIKPRNDNYYLRYLQQPSVVCALHVGSDRKFNELNQGKSSVKQMLPDMFNSVGQLIDLLLVEGYRFLFWNGNFDLMVPPNKIENFIINSLKQWKKSNQFYSAKKNFLKLSCQKMSKDKEETEADDEVDGYVKQVDNLTVAVIRDAGHLCPMDKTEVIVSLMTKFVKEEKLF